MGGGGAKEARSIARGTPSSRERNTDTCLVRSTAGIKAAAMSAPAADDEVGRMSAVSSEGEAAAIKDGRGKGSVKDRAAATAGSEREDGGSNSGGVESSDGGGDSSDGEEVKGRYYGVLSLCAWASRPSPASVCGCAGERTTIISASRGFFPAAPKDRSLRTAGTLCLHAVSVDCKHHLGRGALGSSERSRYSSLHFFETYGTMRGRESASKTVAI